MDAPFVWGSDGSQLTPEQIAARRKAADAMMVQGMDASPIRSWTQGLARVAQGAMGGLDYRSADNAERANADENKKLIASLLSGGSTAATPAASISTSPAVGSAAPADTTGKIYRNDEPSPLDPPSGQDRQNMIATILGEAGNESQLGKNAVASVIRTRAVDGGYGGNTPSAVVQAPNQFEPWSTDAGRQRMTAAAANPQAAASADAAIRSAYGEGGKAPEDPTEGMTHFYSPSGQTAMGRSAPPWAGGESVTIGGHVFNSPDDAKGVQVASNDPAAIPVNAQPTQGALPQTPVAKVAGALSGVNPNMIAALTSPYASESTKKIAGALLTAQMTKQDETAVVGGKLVNKKTGAVVYDGEEDKPKWGVVGKDQYGQPTYGYPPTRAEAAAAKSAAPAPSDQPDLTNVHGKEYMDTIAKSDPKYASQVQAIIEGRAPYPTGMLLKTPYGQRLAQDVTQADPSFESGNATARVKTRNEFMTGGVGSPAGQITAGNTALQHAGEMSDALERMKEGGGIMRDLGNAGIPVVSYAANQIKNKSVQGTPEGAALNDFMTAKNHFSEEVTKFYAGSAGSEAERTRALANLDAAKSLPELRSAIKTEVNLMQGKVNALQDRWKNGMGPLVPEFPLIQPKSQDAINRVIQRHQASEAPAPAGGSVDPDALAEAKRRGLIH
jgi:spore germination cell wall hydrolase CwlJ-like protein